MTMLFRMLSLEDSSSSRAMAGTHFLATVLSCRHNLPKHADQRKKSIVNVIMILNTVFFALNQ